MTILCYGLGKAQVELPQHVQKTLGKEGRILPGLSNSSGASFFPTRPLPDLPGFKVSIGSQGLYRLSRVALTSAGVSPTSLRGANIRMFHRDEEIAIWVSTDGTFGSSDHVTFYGEGSRGSHTSEEAYWLVVDPQKTGLRVESVGGETLANQPEVTSYKATDYIREKLIFRHNYRSHDEDIDHIDMDKLFVNTPRPLTFSVSDLDSAAGPATMYVKAADLEYQNVNLNQTPPSQQLRFASGGSLLGSLSFQRNGRDWYKREFPSNLIGNGNQTISLELTTGSGAFLVAAALEYPRTLKAQAGKLSFDGAIGARNYKVTNLSSSSLMVLDITDSNRPKQLRNPSVSGSGGNRTLRFGHIAGQSTTYYLSQNNLIQAASIQAVPAPTLIDPNQRADYIIITDRSVFSSVDTLANYRRGQGLEVRVVDMQEIYDQFSYGIKTPEAIKNFLGYAYYNWRQSPPRMVLLLGAANIDSLNTMSGSNKPDIVPTWFSGSSFNYAATDSWFGAVKADPYPTDQKHNLMDITVTRLPLRNNTELNWAIAKIQSYEAAPRFASWRSKNFMAAAETDSSLNFEGLTENLRLNYCAPNGISTVTSYGDAVGHPAVKSSILNAFVNNNSMIGFSGHGIITRWQGILQIPDIANLNNTVYPIVTAFGCSTAAFGMDSDSGCLGESFVRIQRGAVASIGATDDAQLNVHSRIAEGFFRSNYDEKVYRIDRAYKNGLLDAYNFSFGVNEIKFYALFSDPALVLNPEGSPSADSDFDGMPNGWEVMHGLEPWIDDASDDPDFDALTNLQEYQHSTHPQDDDTDEDGMIDSWEVVINSNPLSSDSDNDGMPDAWEWKHGLAINAYDKFGDLDNDGLTNFQEYTLGTFPDYADSDFDGLDDRAETQTYNSDPHTRDTDGDGLFDGEEVEDYSTSPTSKDSDNNGIPDGWGQRPNDPALLGAPTGDADGDGLNHLAEAAAGTNPLNPDTDGDGLTDGYEVNTSNSSPLHTDTDNDGVDDRLEDNDGTNPNSPDTDGDQLPDLFERLNDTDPLVNDAAADPDNDGLLNLGEYLNGTRANDSDTDDDGLNDGDEVLTHMTDPLDTDSDNDGLLDGEEIAPHGTDPLNADTDSDGIDDATEVSNNFDPNDTDSDNDGMPDGWEYSNGLNPLGNDTAQDPDNDGLNNLAEFNEGTDPRDEDTDSDGLIDGAEVNTHATNPTRYDTDNDGASDGKEILTSGTNPNLRDTDSDGMDDGFEITRGLNPLFNDAALDPDNDGLTNLQEESYNLDPFNPDTDGDGLSDGYESVNNPHASMTDTDRDGLNDGQEVNVYGTNPNRRDTDADGIRDGDEVNTYNTNPNVDDSDLDGIEDGDEVANGLNPLVADASADPDNDGISNIDEIADYTDPLNDDSDSDGLKDGVEKAIGSNPNQRDTDGDGLFDGAEQLTHGSSPLLADSDYDGMPDGWEVSNGLNPNLNDALLDADGEGIPNYEEYEIGSDPQVTDSDGDSIDDLLEQLFGTSANSSDTDGDGMPDDYEISHALDPLVDDANEDPDADSHSNYGEYLNGTDPNNRESVFLLRIRSVTALNVILEWNSFTGQSYRLMSCANLGQSFTTISSGIPATPPMNSTSVSPNSLQCFKVESE